MPVVPCASCWEPYSVNGTATYMCPESVPFVSGSTESCGCMDPYHNKVCTQSRCCSVDEECYGNCGELLGMYIAIGVILGAAIVVCCYYYIVVRPRKTTATTTTAPPPTEPAANTTTNNNNINNTPNMRRSGPLPGGTATGRTAASSMPGKGEGGGGGAADASL